ncbi:hypothetical protein BS78_10G129400 [Paspalum vaginatum]|nr:hypothetical protein BS78_10G129400 [Paspalum vaginatum]
MATSWVILGRILRAEEETRSVPVVLPARVTVLSAGHSMHPDPSLPDKYPYIIAAGPLCLLANFAVAPSIGACFSDFPHGTSLALVRNFHRAQGQSQITASLERVPDRPGHVPAIFNIGGVGLISDDEGGYTIAELQFPTGIDSETATLVCFRSDNHQWYSQEVGNPLPEEERGWFPHGAVSIDGTIWWFDLTWGIISCDPSAMQPSALFHGLPDDRALDIETVFMFSKRCITVSQSQLRYVEIVHEAATVSMWTRIMGPDGWHWDQKYVMSFQEIWNDHSYREAGLRPIVPDLALVSPLDANLVYFALHQCLFCANVPDHRVVHYEDHEPVNMTGRPPLVGRFVLPWSLPQAVAPGAAGITRLIPAGVSNSI